MNWMNHSIWNAKLSLPGLLADNNPGAEAFSGIKSKSGLGKSIASFAAADHMEYGGSTPLSPA